MSESNFKKLQRVQNTLARVVLGNGKYEHSTPAQGGATVLKVGEPPTFWPVGGGGKILLR